MFSLQKYRFCFMAGLCAAGGSFFGKMPSFLMENRIQLIKISFLTLDLQYYAEFLLYRCVPIVIMILCNILNWRYFLKALQLSEQTLTVTVLTAASNYVVSFILGALVYKEPITFLATLGSTLIVLGLWFLCDETHENKIKIIKKS